MNKQKVNGIKMVVKFKEFKNNNGKVDYYVDEDFINSKIRISNSNMNKAYKKKRNKTTVIRYEDKLYFSEQGFKDLINICHKRYRKDTADLLLGKYKNKNRRNKDTITKQSVEGAINRNRQPLSINILKFDNEIFLIANELVESIDCSSRDFMKALDKKIFFDKTNYKTLREKKRYKTIAMNKEGFLQICRELKLKEEQYKKVLKIYE